MVAGGGYNAGGGRDFMVVAYDSAGNELWARLANGPTDRPEFASAITIDDDGTIFVTGETDAVPDRNFFTVAFDSSGNELWSHAYDGGGRDQALGVAAAGAGAVLVAGHSYGPQREDFLTLKLGPDVAAPTDPTWLASTTHLPGAWSTTPAIGMEWSGAADESGGSGVDLYRVLFDDQPSTVPDATTTVSHDADPHSTSSTALSDGEWSFHLSTCDNAGNCTNTVHLGPFGIDMTMPGPPGPIGSGSHDGGPSSDDGIDIAWSVADDGANASGIDGYGVVFDDQATSACDEIKDVEEDALAATSAPLADGSWYAHVCAVDHAGNWGPAVHGGPYVVDGTGPVPPVVATSTSHGTDPSTDPVIVVEWTPAVDGGTSVAGYGWSYSTADSWVCDQITDGDDATLSASSTDLGDGDWFFHICAMDALGNWGPGSSHGPWTVDTTGPRVVAVDSVPEAGFGDVATPEIGVALTQVLVGFDEEVATFGAGSVTDSGNWRLVRAGEDQVLHSTSCEETGNDDVLVDIPDVRYDAANRVAGVGLGRGPALAPSLYRLLACSTLTDVAGNGLDGITPGVSEPWATDFEVVVDQLLDNPNFDGSLDDWMTDGPSPSDWVLGPDDAEGRVLSRAARVDTVNGTSGSYTLAQCFELPERETSYEGLSLSSALRVDSDQVDLPEIRALIAFSELPACSNLGAESGILGYGGDSSGSWISVGPSGLVPVPAGASSFRLRLEIAGESLATFTVDLDRLLLLEPAGILFFDGFESGDAARW